MFRKRAVMHGELRTIRRTQIYPRARWTDELSHRRLGSVPSSMTVMAAAPAIRSAVVAIVAVMIVVRQHVEVRAAPADAKVSADARTVVRPIAVIRPVPIVR
jgi:hypothetical protein